MADDEGELVRQLIDSFENGDTRWTQLLRDGKVDINAKHGRGGTALVHAAAVSKPAMVDRVLQAKADVNLQDSVGRTPLIHATMAAPVCIIPLLEARADVNHRAQDGRGALVHLLQRTYVTKEEKEEMYILVRKLIRSNADVNIRTELGESPLICAAAHNPHCIRTLLESKANPLLQTKYGDTAISEARRHGHTTEAKLIEEAEQNPEHLEAKFNQNAYIVLMISGQGLTCKNNVQCQQVPLNAKPPKGQPYLRVFHDNKLLMKVFHCRERVRV